APDPTAPEPTTPGPAAPDPDVLDPGDPILSVRGLRTSFFTDRGEVRAVDDVSFDVPRGQTVCVVGESGSGKTATARSVLQVVDRPGRVVGGSMDYRPEPGAEAVDLA